jgi:hypothetical protein
VRPQTGEPDHIKCTTFIRPAGGRGIKPAVTDACRRYVITLYVCTPRNTNIIPRDSLFSRYRTVLERRTAGRLHARGVLVQFFFAAQMLPTLLVVQHL